MTEPIANEPMLSNKHEGNTLKPKLDVAEIAPPKQPQDKRAEDVVHLNRLKEEIKTEVATTESGAEKNPGPTQPQPDNQQNKKPNPIRNSINWLKYPSINDNYKINSRVFMPAFAGTIVSFLGIYVATLPQFTEFAASHQALAGNFILGSLGLLVPSGITMLGSVAVRERTKSIEIKNRMPFSRLLTVSKVFTSEKSTLQPAFEKIDSSFKSGFTGELHFVGINRASWEGITNPLTTLKEGFTGLHNLATACEQNDPKLQDINLFGGISPIVSTSLEKYGFHTLSLDEVVKPSIMGKVMHFMAELRGEDKTYPNGHESGNEEAHVGVINRKDLILHKDDFAREVTRIDTLEKKRYKKEVPI